MGVHIAVLYCFHSSQMQFPAVYYDTCVASLVLLQSFVNNTVFKVKEFNSLRNDTGIKFVFFMQAF